MKITEATDKIVKAKDIVKAAKEDGTIKVKKTKSKIKDLK